FFSSRRRHTRSKRDWSSDVCSSDLGGMIASALFSGVLIYVGWKNYRQLWAKILFWLGVVGLIFSVLNMLAVRFLIIAAIVLFLKIGRASCRERVLMLVVKGYLKK